MQYTFFGKVIGGSIGLMAGGIAGLILGVLVGHAFDRGLGEALRFGSLENIERIKNSFFETSFLLLGYVAKVDGRVSKSEIDHTEQLFVQMGLTAGQRQRAIELFRRGTAADFQVESVVAEFLQTCGPQRQLRQTLLLFLISLARADQGLEPGEHEALVLIATLLGPGAAQLERLLRMSRAQEHFHHGSGSSEQPGTRLDDAYAALGVGRSVTDKELKRAYRKRMSENHPDKLIAQGVPEDMVKLATARSQEIQSAYEMIRKTRPEMR